MGSALTCGFSYPGFDRGQCVLYLQDTLLSQCPSPPTNLMLRGSPAIYKHRTKSGVEILLVSSQKAGLAQGLNRHLGRVVRKKVNVNQD